MGTRHKCLPRVPIVTPGEGWLEGARQAEDAGGGGGNGAGGPEEKGSVAAPGARARARTYWGGELGVQRRAKKQRWAGSWRDAGETEKHGGPHLPQRARARTHTHARTHSYSCPCRSASNFSQRPTVRGGGAVWRALGALDQVGPDSRLRGRLCTPGSSVAPLPAPGFSLTPFPHLQNCPPTPLPSPRGCSGPRESGLAKLPAAEGEVAGVGARRRSAITLAAAPPAGWGWRGVRPPPRDPPFSCPSSASPSSSQTTTIPKARGSGGERGG